MEETGKKLLGSVAVPQEIVDDLKSVKNITSLGKKIGEYEIENTTSLLDVVLVGAINLGVSDIHIEPEKERAKLRMRVDGILQDTVFLGSNAYNHLLSRIKLLSKIKLNITDKPQDGRFTITINDLLVEIRTSSLPAEYGEAIVMRVLNPGNFIKLESLGLRKDLYELLEKEIKRPNGMIVVTGPTGAGKTTTLYSFLLKIQTPEIKIITIEDPIEYHIKGISQTQAAPEKGYGFSEGLKSIVRQDPDVILVGEIRDLETAKIALQASLTGHLVLTTLHTNDAAGTIPRLVDLGAQSSSIAPALKIVVAQRLVRKVCEKCSILAKPSAQELAEIIKNLKDISRDITGVKNLNKIKIAKTKEKGCPACNSTGYRGRIGLFEVFIIDAEIEKFILTNPPTSSIKEKMIKKGMITIYQSGLIEVALGKTTLEEVKKIVEED